MTQREALIADAARAIEVFGEHELERFANHEWEGRDMSKIPIEHRSCLNCLASPLCRVFEAWEIAVGAKQAPGPLRGSQIPQPLEDETELSTGRRIRQELYRTVAENCQIWRTVE
jgi:hypothetical protein